LSISFSKIGDSKQMNEERWSKPSEWMQETQKSLGFRKKMKKVIVDYFK